MDEAFEHNVMHSEGKRDASIYVCFVNKTIMNALKLDLAIRYQRCAIIQSDHSDVRAKTDSNSKTVLASVSFAENANAIHAQGRAVINYA